MVLRGYHKVGSFGKNRPLFLGQRFAGYVNDPPRVRFFQGRPLGSLLGGRGAFPGASTTCLRIALFPWEAWGALSLAECLTACLPELGGYYLPGKDLPWKERRH